MKLPAGSARMRARLRAKLASPRALRETILLHEVLGPPVSLRDVADGAAERH